MDSLGNERMQLILSYKGTKKRKSKGLSNSGLHSALLTFFLILIQPTIYQKT